MALQWPLAVRAGLTPSNDYRLATASQRAQHDQEAGRDRGLALPDTNLLLSWYQLRLRLIAVTRRRQFRNNQPLKVPSAGQVLRIETTRMKVLLLLGGSISVSRDLSSVSKVLNTNHFHTNQIPTLLLRPKLST